MKKKQYEKPSTKVFELKQQPQLLVGSITAKRGNDAYETISAEDPWLNE